MAEAIIFECDTKIKADGFGMANMKESIWFRRKTGDDFLMFFRSQVFGDWRIKSRGFASRGGALLSVMILLILIFYQKKVVRIADCSFLKFANVVDLSCTIVEMAQHI